MAAVMRASHLLVDDPPAIFRDDYALALSEFTADEALDLARGFEPAVGAVFRATAIVRAGLASFAWRRPELVSKVRVFEVDHPGTQAYKRERLAAEGLIIPASLHFVPFDFTAETNLGAALGEAGFRSDRSTLWSWLGVIVYLMHDQIRATLERLAEVSAPGSVLVAEFLLARSSMDDVARAADGLGRAGAADKGDPY